MQHLSPSLPPHRKKKVRKGNFRKKRGKQKKRNKDKDICISGGVRSKRKPSRTAHNIPDEASPAQSKAGQSLPGPASHAGPGGPGTGMFLLAPRHCCLRLNFPTRHEVPFCSTTVALNLNQRNNVDMVKLCLQLSSLSLLLN